MRKQACHQQETSSARAAARRARRAPVGAGPTRRRAQIFPPDEKIDAINDTYWTVRAEPDDDAEVAGAGPSSLIHVYHYHADAQNHVRARRRHAGGRSCVHWHPKKMLHSRRAWISWRRAA